MAQHEQYEVWILNAGEWMFNSAWHEFEVAWAAAQVQTAPLRIMHVTCEDDGVVVRNVVAELRAARKTEPAGVP